MMEIFPSDKAKLPEKYHFSDQIKSIFTHILICYNEAHTQEEL